jgi:hypothetical protein
LPGTAGFSLLLEKCGKLVWQIARRRTQRAAQDNARRKTMSLTQACWLCVTTSPERPGLHQADLAIRPKRR